MKRKIVEVKSVYGISYRVLELIDGNWKRIFESIDRLQANRRLREGC